MFNIGILVFFKVNMVTIVTQRLFTTSFVLSLILPSLTALFFHWRCEYHNYFVGGLPNVSMNYLIEHHAPGNLHPQFFSMVG